MDETRPPPVPMAFLARAWPPKGVPGHEDDCTLLLRELDGKRRVALTFSVGYFLPIAQAIRNNLGRADEQKRLASELAAQDTEIRSVAITGLRQHIYTFQVCIRSGGHDRVMATSAHQAIVLAFTTGCPLLMDEALLDRSERNLAQVQDSFIIVDDLKDLPALLADHQARYGTPDHLPKA